MEERPNYFVIRNPKGVVVGGAAESVVRAAYDSLKALDPGYSIEPYNPSSEPSDESRQSQREI